MKKTKNNSFTSYMNNVKIAVKPAVEETGLSHR